MLNTTANLIAGNDPHTMLISQISKRSGVSTENIDRCFSSKEAIINHLYVDLRKEMIDAAFWGYDIQAPYKERFILLWHNSLNYLISKPMWLSFIEQDSIYSLMSESAKEESARYRVPLLRFITEGIKSGHLKKMHIPLMLSLIYGTIVGTAKLELSNSLEITDEHRESASQACWDGLKAG